MSHTKIKSKTVWEENEGNLDRERIEEKSEFEGEPLREKYEFEGEVISPREEPSHIRQTAAKPSSSSKRMIDHFIFRFKSSGQEANQVPYISKGKLKKILDQ